MPKLFLIDAMAIVFRAHYAMTGSRFQSPLTGEPTGAVYGFTSILLNILEKEKPDYLAIAFDTKEPTFRHKDYPLYKANRAEFPEELVPQLARIKELITAWNIPMLEIPGFEADDIIGSMAGIAARENMQVFCVTPDKDYFQLVSDLVSVYRPSSKSGEYDIITAEGVHEKFGVPPHLVIDVLALTGDSSDNVPGVKGVGEKTAIPLVQEYGKLENIYDRLADIKKDSLRTKLEEHREAAFLSKHLVTIVQDMQLPLAPQDLYRRPANMQAIAEIFKTLGFKSLYEKIARNSIDISNSNASPEQDSVSTPDTPQEQEPILTLHDIQHDYVLVTTDSQLQEIIDKSAHWKAVTFDTETSSLDAHSCSLIGISLCAEEGKAYYIPIMDDNLPQQPTSDTLEHEQFSMFDEPVKTTPAEHKTTKNNATISQKSLQFLSDLLANPNIVKIAQNAKFDLLVLRRYGIEINLPLFDTMLAHYVVQPDMAHGMDAMALQYLRYRPIPITQLIGEKKKEQRSMADLPPEAIKDYAAEDADVTHKLHSILAKQLHEQEQTIFADTVEFPLVPVLVTIESNGVAINTSALQTISQRLTETAAQLTEKIYEKTGERFNIDSPKQLAEILFDKMGIEPLKKTKTGFSTDVSVLEELAEQHPVAADIVEYRQVTKLRSTYSEALPKLIHPRTGLLHTSYNQAVTSTGRLSSTDPNLQNIPIRTAEGRLIRTAFISRFTGGKIMSADYSQIELRIMAAISNDQGLRDAFAHGADIHAATAARLYNVPLHEVSSEQRRAAKAVNFGIMYGLGAFGLAQRLGISRTEGKEIITNYFASYPGIKQYIDSTITLATEKGYTQTLSGRRRYFPDLQSRNRVARTAAERAAINMPIQGTAADMMKLAMIAVHNAMKQHSFKSLMVLQVHDELVFDVYPGEEELLTNVVRNAMETAFPLDGVPVVVETGIGEHWGEAH